MRTLIEGAASTKHMPRLSNWHQLPSMLASMHDIDFIIVNLVILKFNEVDPFVKFRNPWQHWISETGQSNHNTPILRVSTLARFHCISTVALDLQMCYFFHAAIWQLDHRQYWRCAMCHPFQVDHCMYPWLLVNMFFGTTRSEYMHACARARE